MRIKQVLSTSAAGLALLAAAGAVQATVITKATMDGQDFAANLSGVTGIYSVDASFNGSDQDLDILLDTEGATTNQAFTFTIVNDTDANWYGITVEFFTSDFGAGISDQAPAFVNLPSISVPAGSSVAGSTLDPVGLVFTYEGAALQNLTTTGVVGDSFTSFAFSVQQNDPQLPQVSGFRITADTTNPASSVPLPGIASLLGLGLIGLIGARTRG